MIRGGTAGAIVRLGAPRPPQTHPRAEEAAAKGPLRSVGTGGGQRSKLNSGRRRLLDDVGWAAVRHERLEALLLQRAGLESTDSDAAQRLARWLGRLVLHAGLPPASAQAAWGGRDPLDWEAFVDPGHTLVGWVLETGPSPEVALGVACSLPDAVARRLLKDHRGGVGIGRVPDADREALDVLGDLAEPILLARSLNQRAPLTLRVNRARSGRDAVRQGLAAEGITARPTRWTDDGLIVDGRPDVQQSGPVKQGLAEVQDEGSALLVDLLDPQPGQTILDACAGAGGKSLAIASRLGEGRLFALDVRREALDELRRRAARAGARVKTSVVPPRGPLPGRVRALAGKVDAVLLDVPCSSSGALRRRPSARRRLADAEIDGYRRLQSSILARHAALVRPGGRLVYTTCSVFAAENEDVVEAFLRSPEGADYRVLPARAVLGSAGAALGADRWLRLLPHRHGTDGFFGAVLVRNGSDASGVQDG